MVIVLLPKLLICQEWPSGGPHHSNIRMAAPLELKREMQALKIGVEEQGMGWVWNLEGPRGGGSTVAG